MLVKLVRLPLPEAVGSQVLFNLPLPQVVGSPLMFKLPLPQAVGSQVLFNLPLPQAVGSPLLFKLHLYQSMGGYDHAWHVGWGQLRGESSDPSEERASKENRKVPYPSKVQAHI